MGVTVLDPETTHSVLGAGGRVSPRLSGVRTSPLGCLVRTSSSDRLRVWTEKGVKEVVKGGRVGRTWGQGPGLDPGTRYQSFVHDWLI